MTASRARWLTAWLAAWGAACVTGDTYGTAGTHSAASGNSGKAGAAAGGSHGAGTTGAGASTGSGISASTGTGGSSGSTGCPAEMMNPPLTDCGDGDAGLFEVRSNLVNPFTSGGSLGQGTPVTQPVQFLDLDNLGATVTSGACGVLIYCVPPGHVLEMAGSVTSYESVLVEDLGVTSNLYFQEIDMLPSVAADYLQSILPSYDPTQPAVFVRVRTSVSQCPWNGWTFSLVEADAGTPVTSSVAYFSGSGFGTAQETDNEGAALFYNVVSPSTGKVSVQGTIDPAVEAVFDQDAGVDAGYCAFDLHAAAFLGTARVDPMYPITFFVFQLP